MVGCGAQDVHHLCEQVGRTLRMPCFTQRLQHTGHTKEIMIGQSVEWSATMIRVDIPIAIAVKIHIVQVTAARLAIVLQRTLIVIQHCRKILIYRRCVSIETARLRCREYPLNEIVVRLHLIVSKHYNIFVAMRNTLIFIV